MIDMPDNDSSDFSKYAEATEGKLKENTVRKNFEMTPEQFSEIMDACKPQPMIAIHCGNPPSPQEMANDAWAKLGKQLGFKHMTVQPTGKGERFFSAESIEWHQGDPCIKCGTPHDDVEPGPCGGRI